MGGVAVGAVFCHGLVLEQEGTAFFSVALIASFSDCIFLPQFGACRTMGVVTIGTSYFAFFKGVVRDFFAIRTLLFVAGVANFSLSFFGQHFVGWAVHFVAIVTSHTTGVVLAAIPVVAFAVLVAS